MVEPKWELVRELEAWGGLEKDGSGRGGSVREWIGSGSGKNSGKIQGQVISNCTKKTARRTGTCKLDWVIRTCKVGVENGRLYGLH